MTKDRYFYCVPGEAPRGPLPIQAIRTAVASGQLPGSVNLSTTPTGPWNLLSSVDSRHYRKVKARDSNKRLAGMMILLALTLALCGLCVWVLVHQNKVKKPDQPELLSPVQVR